MLRDGRDVVCSLLEKPWLRPSQTSSDDAGVAYGSYARFWVEPERREEFETASDARRAAWVWRRYVTAARSSGGAIAGAPLRAGCADPAAAAEALAGHLDAPREPLAEALARAHASSIGRYRDDLDATQLQDVLDEAGGLLRELGYPGELTRVDRGPGHERVRAGRGSRSARGCSRSWSESARSPRSST